MTEVVSSKPAKRLKRWHVVVFVMVIIAAVAGAGVYWVDLVRKRPAIEIGTGPEVGALVSTLPPQQLEQVASVYIVNPSWDMDWAYARATALSIQGEHEDSLGAYKALIDTGKAPYYIYVDYALAAQRAGDDRLAIDMMTKAISVLEGDASVNKSTKEFIKKRLNSKIDSFKMGAE